MKPVASGATRSGNQWIHEDLAQLSQAGSPPICIEQQCCYLFEPAIAPHIAAQTHGVDMRLEVIVAAYQTLAQQHDAVVVEGIGGFRVPLGPQCDTADMTVALGLPIILVVGMRLGCLNHALLTAEAIQTRGLKLAGWVASQIDPKMTEAPRILDALQQRLPATYLGHIPYLSNPNFKQALTYINPKKLGSDNDYLCTAQSNCASPPKKLKNAWGKI